MEVLANLWRAAVLTDSPVTHSAAILREGVV